MLKEALSSALAQTYGDLEITVVDNASTDETVEVAQEVAKQDSRVHVYVNDHDVGGMNYSKTLDRSRGELIKYLNSDDRLEPTCVERLVEAIDHPGIALSFCLAKYIDAAGDVIEVPNYDRLLRLEADRVINGIDLGDRMLATNANLIGIPTQVLWRRSALNGAPMGFGQRTWQVLGDLALWLSILVRGDAAYVHDELTIQRKHPGQFQSAPDFRIRHAFDWLEICNVAAGYGFLRDQAQRSSATTVALRQLAWRFDDALPQAESLLEGVRMACERLRVTQDNPPGVGNFLGLKTFLFVEEGDGEEAARIVQAWLEAFPERMDVRLLIAAAPRSLPQVQAMLRPLREDPGSPLSLNLVEEVLVAGVIPVRGPLYHVKAGASTKDFLDAIPYARLGQRDNPWKGPTPEATSSKAARLRIIRWSAAELGLVPGPAYSPEAFVDI